VSGRDRCGPPAALRYVAVALGSVIGAIARVAASRAFDLAFGTAFPWGTLFVNVAGSFLIGFYATLTGPQWRLPARRHLVMTGFCGGFTTFSAFSLETFDLAAAGHVVAAAGNLGISVASWLVAVWAGTMLAIRRSRP
jgi:CrcB protein